MFRAIILYLAFLILAALIRQKRGPKGRVSPPTPHSSPKRAVLTAGRGSMRTAQANLPVCQTENGEVPLSSPPAPATPSLSLAEASTAAAPGAATAENFLGAQNLLTGLILAEVLGPPRARRYRPRR